MSLDEFHSLATKQHPRLLHEHLTIHKNHHPRKHRLAQRLVQPFVLTTELGSDPARLHITAWDNPSGIPQQRFARVMVALDSDGDGLPDDWEIAHGMSAFDATDHFNDVDGDGDTAWQEFFQGTDPLNAQSNSAQFRIPRTPIDALVVGVENFQVMWRDVSDNETEFRIYNGGTLVGTAAPNETVFQLPPTITTPITISLTAANAFGESAHVSAEDRTGGGNYNNEGEEYEGDGSMEAGTGFSDAKTSEEMGKPTIKIARISPQTVQLGWDCGPIAIHPEKLHLLKVRILKQAQMQEWQIVDTKPYATKSEVEVGPPYINVINKTGTMYIPAQAGTTWRFAAVTLFETTGPNPSVIVGSDCSEIQVDDYVASLFGTKVYRGYYTSTMTPIGELLNGGVIKSGTPYSYKYHNCTFLSICLDPRSLR
jgi:hypothetical protein